MRQHDKPLNGLRYPLVEDGIAFVGGFAQCKMDNK